MKRLIFLMLACLIGTAYAQKNDSILLYFNAYDDFTQAGVKDSKAYLMTADSVVFDSCEAKFEKPWWSQREEYQGFEFKIPRSKSLREFIIKIVHPQYTTVYKKRSFRHIGKLKSWEVPPLFMKRKNTFLERRLDDVVVTATKVKFYYDGDTLVYNADAFNVADGSMLDALILQLPGVELKEDGEITVNGHKIDNLLLNGKNFFSGRRKLMLENLPYYTVKDIRVYDKTTDRALALNDEDAGKDYVMDVKLKKEYSKGYIGNADFGIGTEDRYMARFFGARFTDLSQFAIVAGINNLNRGNHTVGNGSGVWYDMDKREGETEEKTLNAEYSLENKKRKNILTLDVEHSKSNTGMDVFQETYQNNDASTFGVSRSSDMRKNLNAFVKNHFTLNVPFWFESITQLRYGKGKDESQGSEYESKSDTRHDGKTVLDSLFNMGVSVNDPLMQVARMRSLHSDAKRYEAAQDINIGKNVFNADIIELNASINYRKSESDAERFNRYLGYVPTYSVTDITESIDRPNTHFGAEAKLSYDFKRLFDCANMTLFINYRFGRDKNSETITDISTSMFDAENSFNRRMTENVCTSGLSYRYWKLVKKLKNNEGLCRSVKISVPFTIMNRNTNYQRYTVDTCITQTPVFLEPTISFELIKDSYNKNVFVVGANSKRTGIANVLLSTSLKYEVADALSLITLPLTSDKINHFRGNADLKNASTWNSTLFWNVPVQKRKGYFSHEINYRHYFNRIVNSYSYNSGVYTYTPENIDGTWNLDTKVSGDFKFKILKQYPKFTWSVYGAYGSMKNYVADGTTGSSKLIKNNDLYVSVPLTLSMYLERAFVRLYATVDWRKALSKEANIGYSDAMEYKYGVYTSLTLPAKINFENTIYIKKRSGYANDELNRYLCEWDVSLQRSIMKNRINLKLSAIDVFRQYKAITYVTNERGIRETRAVSIPSHVLFSLSYRFNKNPEKKM